LATTVEKTKNLRIKITCQLLEFKLLAKPFTSLYIALRWCNTPLSPSRWLPIKMHKINLPNYMVRRPGAQVQYNDTTASVRNDFDATIRKGDAGRESAVAFVEEAISKALAGILFVDVESIDSAKSVADFGLDSLTARQLQHWFLEAPGANVSVSSLLDPSESIRTRAANITDAALGGGV
jgi:aryl carrier-like protein